MRRLCGASARLHQPGTCEGHSTEGVLKWFPEKSMLTYHLRRGGFTGANGLRVHDDMVHIFG